MLCNTRNRSTENLIKPVEYGDFGSQKAQKAPKTIKKPLGFSLFRAWHSADPQNLIKPVENDDSEGALHPHGKKNRSSGLGDSHTHPAARPDRCLETCSFEKSANLFFLPKPIFLLKQRKSVSYRHGRANRHVLDFAAPSAPGCGTGVGQIDTCAFDNPKHANPINP